MFTSAQCGHWSTPVTSLSSAVCLRIKRTVIVVNARQELTSQRNSVLVFVSKMRLEVESAANFLSDLLRVHQSCPSAPLLERFRLTIIDHLVALYVDHWFPDRPNKGSAYRCLRINHKMDPTLAAAGRLCGLNDAVLRMLFPNELTLWIDPQEVSYRIGENGSICVIYEPLNTLSPSPTPSHFTSSSSQSSSMASSPSSSPNWFQAMDSSSSQRRQQTSQKTSFYLNSFPVPPSAPPESHKELFPDWLLSHQQMTDANKEPFKRHVTID
ncbi:unnamed protein product [Medioppia subpectinata]|uniref:Anti-proliferative protein domain-containing protein n=1 Tax=Medioppia subpectinata TaxID=1979941 RepID=A0A7R9PWM2_9ACAR|nr:unnamed protein product [Medioppia subpectinata]CAG2103921.1 unnamed protein product [Medioppia subpectinata]